MKKLLSIITIIVLLGAGLFILTGCDNNKENGGNSTSANIQKYTINPSYGGEFYLEFANDLGYEAKEERNTLVFTHKENKSTIRIYTMDTSTSSILMKEKDFSSTAYSGYKELEINGHKAYTITSGNNYAIIYGIQLEKDERDPNINYKYFGVKIEVSKSPLKLDDFDPTAFVQTEGFQHLLNSIKVSHTDIRSVE